MTTPKAQAGQPARNDQWLLRSRELLDQQAAALPASRLSKLAAARRRALQRAAAPSRRTPLWLAAGLAGAASLALWLGGGIDGGHQPSPDLAPAAPAMVIEQPLDQALTLPSSDVELLVSEEDYALMQDLEFYAWLESGENGS